MSIFSNRELALGIWTILVSFYVLIAPKSKGIRGALKNLIDSFFVRRFLYAMIFMLIYIGSVVYLLSEIGLWDKTQIKNTIFWYLTFGLASFLKINSLKKDKNFFKHSVLSNLKLLAVFQFIINLISLSLWIEMILVPIVFVLVLVVEFIDVRKENQKLKKLFQFILGIMGLIILSYSIYALSQNTSSFLRLKILYDFIMPTILTFFFFPFLAIIVIYSTYEESFCRLRFAIEKKSLQVLAKFYAIILFNFKYKLVERWLNQIIRHKITNHSQLIKSFKYFFKVYRAEKLPNRVPISEGWSPYRAKDFLVEEGFETGFYERMSQEEWFSSSKLMEISQGIFCNHIAYYVEGNEKVAKILKLNVDITDVKNREESHNKLYCVANKLTVSSINSNLSKYFKEAILLGYDYQEKLGNKTIVFEKYVWSQKHLSQYSLYFKIICGD